MTLATRLIERLAHLPPALSRDLLVQQRLPATMPDGVVLVADRYFSRDYPGAPIVLIRTPYNRAAVGGLMGRIFAERGYQSIVQSVRGTFDSGGTFDAFRNEERDGHATLEWVAQQPWFSGRVGLYGPSYLGLTQWAVAADLPPFVKALAIQVSGASFRDLLYPGGSFGLDGALTWLSIIEGQRMPLWLLVPMQPVLDWRLQRGKRHLPLKETDRVTTGVTVPFFQDWLVHTAPGDPFWRDVDFTPALARVRAPVNLVAGWCDVFVGRQLADYLRMREAGHEPYLTIGPWTHRSFGGFAAGLREGLRWFDTYLREVPGQLRQQPVRIYELGIDRWIDLPSWPPAASDQDWFLHADGRLRQVPAPTAGADSYVYDPADPTPSVGGPLLTDNRYTRDNRSLEQRGDVLTFTSEPLEHDLTVMGSSNVELYVQSSAVSADFFVRLCDVEANGRSLNVIDGIHRIEGAASPRCIHIELSETAYCFRRGHRLRLQVSSGAFPRLARNFGTLEPLGEGRSGVRAQQVVLHGPEHQSRLRVAVVSNSTTGALL